MEVGSRPLAGFTAVEGDERGGEGGRHRRRTLRSYKDHRLPSLPGMMPCCRPVKYEQQGVLAAAQGLENSQWGSQ